MSVHADELARELADLTPDEVGEAIPRSFSVKTSS
jgi:hypothetical protein